MSGFRPAILALFLIAVGVHGDVVVLRDGSERSGTIDLCDEETCRLDGKPILVEGIAAIFFDPSARKLRPKTAGVLLRDGTTRKGSVTFINRGTVDIADDEIDRADVLAVFFVTPEPPPDVVILRDGTRKSGALSVCNAASCNVGGSTVRFADIAWIGLSRGEDESDPPPTTGGDEVHKLDGSVLVARVSRIDAASVSTTRGALPRAETAWIHVAPPAPPPSNQPGAYGAPPGQAPSGPETPRPPTGPGGSQPPAPPAPAPPPPPGNPPGSRAGGWPIPLPSALAAPRRGGLWTGTVVARYRQMAYGVLTRWDIDARVRLREETTPLILGTGPAMRSIGSFSWLIPEGSVISESITCTGEVSCSGSGTITVTGEENKSCSGFWWKNVDVAVAGQYGFEIPPTGLYSICLGSPPSATFEITYRSSDGNTTSSTSSYGSPVIGRHPILDRHLFMDPDSRSFAGGAPRMTGSYYLPANADTGSLRVSWSICRETQNCPPPGPLPPDPEDDDDCPPPASQQALLERALDELRARYRLLKELRAEYKRIENQARQWEGDYVSVTRDCQLLTAAKFLTGVLLGNFAPTTPGRVLVNPGSGRIDTLPLIEPGKSFVNFLNFVEKVVEGDPSWLLPDTEFGPGGATWLSLEDLYDGGSVGWNYLESINATPAEMREQMLSCGSPSIAGAIDGALQYLRHLEELRPLTDRLNTMANDIRNLETNQIEGDLWPDYQRECLAYEACREGGDPSRCNRLPPSGAVP